MQFGRFAAVGLLAHQRPLAPLRGGIRRRQGAGHLHCLCFILLLVPDL
jgi:hypothetical protein